MFNLPNLLTLLNLTSGCLAIVSVFQANPNQAMIFFGAALIFDLLDGLAARGLGQSSEFGVQLDSLADMVSFGVLPGVIFYALIQKTSADVGGFFPVSFGFIYTAAAALRLAKFNLDDRQSFDFLGLNTPAAAIAIVGLYTNVSFGSCPDELLFISINPTAVLIISFFLSALLLIDLPMLSFKPSFKDKTRSRNQLVLIAGGVIILFIMKTCALPFLVLWYIIYSIILLLLSKIKK
jgi:CDP-diacylglycerol--serine O-phosphatidyltransferase